MYKSLYYRFFVIHDLTLLIPLQTKHLKVGSLQAKCRRQATRRNVEAKASKEVVGILVEAVEGWSDNSAT